MEKVKRTADSIVRIVLILFALSFLAGGVVWGIIGSDEMTIFFDGAVEYYAKLSAIVSAVFIVAALYFILVTAARTELFQERLAVCRISLMAFFIAAGLLIQPMVTYIAPMVMHRYILVKRGVAAEADIIKKIDAGIMESEGGCGAGFGVVFEIYFSDEYRTYSQKVCGMQKESWENDFTFIKKAVLCGYKTRYGFTLTNFYTR